MKSQDKNSFVEESRKLLGGINIEKLIKDSNELSEISKINRLIAIFTNFSNNDGVELKRLLSEFQKWGRKSTSIGTIRNRAIDMIQFIGQKIEEMDIYNIDPDEKSLLSTLDNLKKVQKLIGEGLARINEKNQVIQEAKERSKLFKEDLYERKAEKLTKRTVWSTPTHDGFVPAQENNQLTPWIEIYEDYLGENARLITEKVIEETKPYDGRKFLRSILEKAKTDIVVVDNFLSHEILLIIEPYFLKGITFKLITRGENNNRFKSFSIDYKVFKQQYPIGVEARENEKCHDRFIVIDNHIVFHFGASLAELGKTLSMANLVEDQKEKDKLFAKFLLWWNGGNEVK